MDKLHQTSAFGGYARDWKGFSISEITNYELVALSAAGGQDKAFTKAIKSKFNCALPAPGKVVPTGAGALMWTGQGRYLAMLDTVDDRADEALAETLGASGYAVLQTDGWGVLQLSGDRIFDVLERFITLDLRGAPVDFAARTSAHHIAVIIVKRLNGSILLLSPRTSAVGFAQALEGVAARVLG